MVKLGFARTSEGGFYGVDLSSGDAILLCCNKSVYDTVSGDEKVIKVVESEDICEILKIGDYVNGYPVNDINVQGRYIYCDNYHKEFTPEQVIDVTTKERYQSVNFEIQKALDRAKEIDEKGW